MTDAFFRETAPQYMHMLLEDFPTLGKLDAAAVFGNAGHESGGFLKLQELKPTVPGSRGGYGWFQWTGSRRREYEEYCQRTGKDPADPASNYAWLYLELRGPEAKAIDALLGAETLFDKVEAFEKSFERAGIKHYNSRRDWAKTALHAYEAWLAQRVDEPESPLPDFPEDMANLESIHRLAALGIPELQQMQVAIAMAFAMKRGWQIKDPTQPEVLALPNFTTQPQETSMNGIKSWFQSKGMLGGIATIAMIVGPMFGLDLGQATVNEATVEITNLIASVTALIGLWGRMTAKSQIKPILKG